MASIAKTQLRPAGLAEQIEISLIKPPRFKLRTELRDIENLASSIRELGLLQPVVVRPFRNGLELVCGNRRLVACKSLRWHSIPGIVHELSDIEAFELSLTENIQRESLDPIEEAMAFNRYVSKNGHGAIAKLSKKIGKSAEFICHRLALLRLPPETRDAVKDRKISASMAYEMLGLSELGAGPLINQLSNSKLSSKEVRSLVRILRENKSDIRQESTPFFESVNRKNGKEDQTIELLHSAILIYKLAMIRLDALINSCSSLPVRKQLLEQRLRLHEMIDECIISRKEKRSG